MRILSLVVPDFCLPCYLFFNLYRSLISFPVSYCAFALPDILTEGSATACWTNSTTRETGTALFPVYR